MSKRLQVLLEEEELEEIRQMARTQHMTVAEWVRQVLRTARRDEPLRRRQEKLDTIERSSRHAFPAADTEQMLQEIERGYASKR